MESNALLEELQAVQKAKSTMEKFWDCWQLGDEDTYERLKREEKELLTLLGQANESQQ